MEPVRTAPSNAGSNVPLPPGAAQSLRPGRAGTRGNAPSTRARLGILFVLSLLWLLFEFGRPPTPPGIPLLISAALFVNWLGRKDKQWSRQTPWWFVLLAVVAIGITFAPNSYAVYFNTRFMGFLVLGVCLPLQAMVTTVRRLRLWIYSLIGVSVYVGAWAAGHGGYGPAGAWGGQDENYVAALMAMATALSYFSLFAEKRLIPRLLLGFSIVIFVAAIALAQNASRGGFLALCTVALYCVVRSPRKLLGLSVLAAGGIALFAIAGQGFWKEIDSTTDVHEGTGDVRLELWSLGVHMWRAHPLLGVGAGNYRWVVGDYQTPEQMEKFGHSLTGSIIAHSLPVELISELGSAGAIAVLVLLWCTWADLGKVMHQIPPPREAPPGQDADLAQLRCYADALRGAILGIMVAGVFLSMLWYSHLWVLLAVGSAVPFVYRRIQGRDAGGAPTRPAERGASSRRGRGLSPQAPLNPGPGLGSGVRS